MFTGHEIVVAHFQQEETWQPYCRELVLEYALYWI